ncbi:hypothetical protein [Alkalihalobacillus trypoxylicola]|uniref:Zinc-finger domain-containing protein n=1 Tax=Alkalihalobacillus trypoxylicola TaxID=519424 RepID=A0A162D604_9BACI|nr:hypothetical protein [Alkalihalobacillus trypoxylicola]KYG28242.1 hypothetical protein AZF04_10105 [Alkalihalobacillus trypoxylicola]
MKEEEKIHILSNELIPILDELEKEAKDIVLEHMNECSDCQRLYNEIINDETPFPKYQQMESREIAPFKKLLQFNRGLKWLFISIRIIIIFLIVFSALSFYNLELSAQAAMDYIKAGTFMFYFPTMIFLNILSIVFFNKKWLWYFILFDLMIVLFLDRIIPIFL